MSVLKIYTTNPLLSFSRHLTRLETVVYLLSYTKYKSEYILSLPCLTISKNNNVFTRERQLHNIDFFPLTSDEGQENIYTFSYIIYIKQYLTVSLTF